MVLVLWLIVFGCAYGLIYVGADKFIDELKDLSRILRVSPFLIGLIILGIDPEESIASIMAAINGLPYIAVGNVIGNSIIAITLCFSIPALMTTINFEKIPPLYPSLMLGSACVILAGIWLPLNMMIIGLISLVLFSGYLVGNILKYKKLNLIVSVGGNLEEDDLNDNKDAIYDNNSDNVDDDSDDNDNHNDGNEGNQGKLSKKRENEEIRDELNTKIIFKIIIYFALILLGGEGLIYAAKNILVETHIEESFFGFVVIALVTNVEEITLMVKSIKKHQASLGMGGMIGKIIWNIGFTLGVSALIIGEMSYTTVMIVNIGLLLLVLVYFSSLVNKKKIDRMDGLILLIMFMIFIALNLLVS